ncbi:uncharacterized protein LOC135366292 isoform X2 [Ornithodoros turicata]
MSGEPVLLLCEYNLEGAELYSVKWYKDNVEFYRYLPSDVPPGQKYDLVGLYVNLSRSNHSRVFLERTDLNSEGSYGCEVSTEGPEYRTIIFEKDLNIYVLPDMGPAIEGVKPRYQVGDVLNATCRSRPSKPAPSLQWIINGEPVPEEQMIRSGPFRRPNALQASLSMLRLPITGDHLARDFLRLRCDSSVNKNHSRSSQEVRIGTHNQPATEKTYEEENAPSIGPASSYYNVGDLLELNCSGPVSTYEVQLEWFINDDEAPASSVRHYPIQRGGEVVLGLQLPVLPKHFRNNELRVRCTATFSRLLTMSSEETILVASRRSSGFHIDGGSRSGVSWLWTLSLLVFL